MHRVYPNKVLGYNCSPSFNWEKNLSQESIASLHEQLASCSSSQFITLAGFHALNHWNIRALQGLRERRDVPEIVRLQRKEFEDEAQRVRSARPS